VNDNCIIYHQILGELPECKLVKITVDGKRIKVREGETEAICVLKPQK